MSRVIKEYPFNKKFGESLIASANTIKDIKLPGLFLDMVDLDTRRSEVIALQAECYCLEEEPGIHVSLVQLDRNNNKTDIKTAETVIDEVAFCDAMYECFLAEQSLEDTPFIRDIVTNLVKLYVKERTTSSCFTTDYGYDGFGVICSGKDIIGTVDNLKISNDFNLTFNYCVGNFNLTNVKDCKIFFTTGKAVFCISDIKACNVASSSDYYCTYYVTDYFFKKEKFPVAEDEYSSFSSFSEFGAEKFLSERTIFLDNHSENEKDRDLVYEGFFDLL